MSKRMFSPPSSSRRLRSGRGVPCPVGDPTVRPTASAPRSRASNGGRRQLTLKNMRIQMRFALLHAFRALGYGNETGEQREQWEQREHACTVKPQLWFSFGKAFHERRIMRGKCTTRRACLVVRPPPPPNYIVPNIPNNGTCSIIYIIYRILQWNQVQHYKAFK